jgi:hypothetical protein
MAQRHHLLLIGLMVAPLAGCPDVDVSVDDPKHPVTDHSLFPEHISKENAQVAAGRETGRSLEQPIAFPHYTHAVTLEMDCQYCHSEARKSIHSGVPPVQTCMNCHQHVKKDAPEPQKMWGYCKPVDTAGNPVGLRKAKDKWQATKLKPGQDVVADEDIGKVDYPAPGAFTCTGDPIPWNKVHDLPDYVNFTHKRHIRGGLDCTECHGQVSLLGQEPDRIMIRETSLQMGWCIDCHGTHPSIDKNYGDKADLRRAELKDCWTCHK